MGVARSTRTMQRIAPISPADQELSARSLPVVLCFLSSQVRSLCSQSQVPSQPVYASNFIGSCCKSSYRNLLYHKNHTLRAWSVKPGASLINCQRCASMPGPAFLQSACYWKANESLLERMIPAGAAVHVTKRAKPGLQGQYYARARKSSLACSNPHTQFFARQTYKAPPSFLVVRW